MHDPGELLAAWNSFYVMIGSSAAALTGLMFVVITLIRDSRTGNSEIGVATFSTPTVVHFCSSLFIAALMSAPLRSLVPIALILAVAGAFGLFYVTRVARMWRHIETYQPDLEDRFCYVYLPFAAYAALVVGAAFLVPDPRPALFVPALTVMVLIFAGIHNAWDVVTYLATGQAERDQG